MAKPLPSIPELLTSISSLRTVPAQATTWLEALPHAALSYSLSGEDVALAKLFKAQLVERRPGTYVDIGAYSPIIISNTYFFYCRDWTGLCIDPNPEVVADWKTYRPRDTFVSTAVGEGGPLVFRRHALTAGMSRVFGAGETAGGDYGPPVEVPSARLDMLLSQHIGDKPIDIMNLDVEGAEMIVLATNDWTRWRPKAICIECLTIDVLRPADYGTVAYLMARGYDVRSIIGDNVILTTGE